MATCGLALAPKSVGNLPDSFPVLMVKVLENPNHNINNSQTLRLKFDIQQYNV